MLTIEQGARTSLYCATSEDVAGASGQYYDKCRETEPSKLVTPELAARVWEYSEAAIAP
jgi:dehydrogenase/reductase SDR family protein 13